MTPETSSQPSSQIRSEISTLFGTVAATYGLSLAGIAPSLVITYFSTRLFAPEIVGQFGLISMVASLVQSIGFVWLSNALIRFGREEYIQTGGVRQTFRVRLILLSAIWLATLLGFAMLYYFAHDLLSTWTGLSGQYLWTVPLFITLGVLGAELSGYLRVFGKYTQLAGATLVNQVFYVVVLIPLYTYLGAGGIGWLIALAIGGYLSQWLYLLLWLKQDDFRLGIKPGAKDALLRTVTYSVPAIGTSVLSYVYRPIELSLIRQFVSIGAVGLFDTASHLNTVLSRFVMSFSNLMFPILQGLRATGNSEMMCRYYQKVVPQVTVLFALFVSGCLVCIPRLVLLLLGEQYHPAIGAFLILAYGEIPHMTTALQSSFSAVYDRTIQAFWVLVLQYFFALGCYFVLIPRIGIEGAAWGWASAYLASAFLLTHYVSREFGAYRRAYLAVGLSAILGMLALFLAESGMPFIMRLLALLGMTIAAVIVSKKARLFDRQDVKLLLATGIPKFLHAPLQFAYRILG
jgi:O-antigen/teichoic acid export membrane protein